MMRKILVGFDGSASGTQALRFAAELAQKFGAELHVLTVTRPPEFGDEVETAAAIDGARRHNDLLMNQARSLLGPEAPGARLHAAIGHPAEQIVRCAELEGVDHIVVGHRGHSVFERWLIGSVARQVIAYAHCAVTVVRATAAPP